MPAGAQLSQRSRRGALAGLTKYDMQLIPDAILQGGKYGIIRTLGQGGFGITYEAEQMNLGRKVVVKEFFIRKYCNRDECMELVIVPFVVCQDFVSRFKEKFLKEARLIGSQDDAHIVKIHGSRRMERPTM